MVSLPNPERAMGIEPTAFSLARRRSTDELRPRNSQYIKNGFFPQYVAPGKPVCTLKYPTLGIVSGIH